MSLDLRRTLLCSPALVDIEQALSLLTVRVT
jgi:hypothetical protein